MITIQAGLTTTIIPDDRMWSAIEQPYYYDYEKWFQVKPKLEKEYIEDVDFTEELNLKSLKRIHKQ